MVAFHVRWRDVARGGLRMSVPVSYGDHAIRAMSAYDEAYALSFAQQLKNKDIPEVRASKMYVNISHAWFLNYGLYENRP